MNINITEYLKQNGFDQTRDSEKQDVFEKDYRHPFFEKNYTVIITITHQTLLLADTGVFFKGMMIELYPGVLDQHAIMLYDGLCPFTFDQVSDLLENTLPTKEFLANKYKPGP